MIPRLSACDQALLCVPTSRLTRLDPPVFRTGRLRLPSPLTVRACRCGHLLDDFAVSAVLGRRVSNVYVMDLDLGSDDRLHDGRLEILADGLPLFGGAQLAIDTTLVSASRQDEEPRRGAATKDGVALLEAYRRKARTYPAKALGAVLWFWQAKKEADGPVRRRHSSLRWPMPKRGQCPQRCGEARRQLGVAGGHRSPVVLRLAHMHRLCLTCAPLLGLTAMSPPCTRWSVTIFTA